MATSTTETRIETVADLHKRLGEVPLDRILMKPAPGTATEEDVIAAGTKTKRLCELVDGVLVEKTMGFKESYLASFLLTVLFEFVRSRNLGLVTGMDGCIRLFPGQVRIPDVAFVSWDRIPGRSFPKKPIPDLVPDLAVEVLSASNTKGEMTRKLQDYFDAGCRLVWYVDPVTETIHVHSALNSVVVLGRQDVIDGGDLLPGLSIKLEDIFSEPVP